MIGFEIYQGLEELHEPHSPIDNPQLTKEAENVVGSIDDILVSGKLTPYEKMVQTESILLDKWEYKKDWKNYLDQPVLAHVNAVLNLKEIYQAFVGIMEAGIPYLSIFKMFNCPVYCIDFSHYKRNMDVPLIEADQLLELRHRDVLLVDIDLVTGKTLDKVTDYLRSNAVNVKGAYIGLSRWAGIESDDPHIGEDLVDFDKFWKRCGELYLIKNKERYIRLGVLPKDFEVYTSNLAVEKNERVGSKAAAKFAEYLK